MNWNRGIGILPTTHRRMDADEYYRLPQGPPYFQLIDGELFMSPSPHIFHQEIVGNLHAALRDYLRQHAIGKVIIAPSDVEFDKDNVFQPDLYFIRTERLGIINEHGVKGAPDLVIEVVSGSTGRLDAGPKKTLYAEKGVVEYWMVWPRTGEVEIYNLAESAEKAASILKGNDILRSVVLPGLALPVAEIFAR